MQGTVTTIPVTFLIQLYAPFVGLLGVVFWLGVLSQRVKVLEDFKVQVVANKDDITVAVLATKLDGLKSSVDRVDREMQVVQRSLANIASGSSNRFVTLDGEHGD